VQESEGEKIDGLTARVAGWGTLSEGKMLVQVRCTTLLMNGTFIGTGRPFCGQLFFIRQVGNYRPFYSMWT